MRFGFALIFICAVLPAFGFTNSFEYHSVSDREAAGFDIPSEIDGEYESDVLTYTQGFEERWIYLSSERAFTGSFGSLDGEHFFSRQSFKAEFAVANQLHFKVLAFRDRDFEMDNQDTIFEFRFDLKPGHSLALYGAASFEKKEDDIGLAYIRRKAYEGGTRTMRVYASATDFSRNDRNTENDKFERDPYVLGVTLTEIGTDRTYRELALRAEPDMKWEFPDEQREYRYSRYYAYAAHRRRRGNGYTGARFEYDQKREGQSQSPIVTGEKWQTRRARLQVERSIELAKTWTFGLWLSHADWEKDAESMQMTYVLPYAAYEWLRTDTYAWSGELSFSSAHRDERIIDEKTPDDGLDARFNLAYKRVFGPNLILKALCTFDVDRLNKSDRWEGGNVQLTSTF